MRQSTERIVPLSEAPDFKVAEGDPDVRSWEVWSADGRRVGKVDELLVDLQARKVRYLDVDVERSAGDRHVLVPIGYARLDEERDRVNIASLTGSDLEAFPAFTRGRVDPDQESKLRRHLDPRFTGPAAGQDLYDSELYDDSGFFGSRRASEPGETRVTRSEEELVVGTRATEAGEVQIDKRVETEHVRREVPTTHEEVVVERRPADPALAAGSRIEEAHVRVPVKEEELVVDKRVVPREELVVRKREVLETEPVEADLRRERVEVHEEGNVNVDERR